MRILFMMPQYRAYSEVWMQRMLGGIRDEVALIASMGIGTPHSDWKDIPHFELKRVPRGGRILDRARLLFPWYLRFRELAHAIEEHRVTHVLCHFGTLAVKYLPVWRKLDIPVFVHLHGFDASFDLRSPDGQKRVHAGDYSRQIVDLSRFARLIVPSEYVRQNVAAIGVPEHRIHVKPVGVPFPQLPVEHFEHEPIRILYIGRFVDVKSPDRLIEAFHVAVAKGLDATLTLVGDGPMLQSCKQLATSLGVQTRVQFAGVQAPDEVEKLLRHCDIYAQHNVTGDRSRQTESLGVSIAEAMSHGIPAACTRSGGIPDTVGPGNEDLLVEPGDVLAHGELIYRLGIDVNYRREAGSRCREHIRRHFGLDLEIRRLRHLFLSEGSCSADGECEALADEGPGPYFC